MWCDMGRGTWVEEGREEAERLRELGLRRRELFPSDAATEVTSSEESFVSSCWLRMGTTWFNSSSGESAAKLSVSGTSEVGTVTIIGTGRSNVSA